MQVVDALDAIHGQLPGARARGEHDRFLPSPPFEEVDNHIPRRIFDLQAAHVDHVDIVHIERIEPFRPVEVIGPVVGDERALTVGLDETIAAAVFLLGILHHHGNPLGLQPPMHEVPERTRSDGREQHGRDIERMGDGERVECAAAQRHLLPVHHDILRGSRQTIDIDDDVGARHTDK